MEREKLMDMRKLEETARAMVAPGKGILAADESMNTIETRFGQVGVESTEDTRRAYREMLFTTPRIGEYLSGVILFDETIRQETSDGRLMTGVLGEQDVIPGIKVDAGAKAMALFPDEKITEGLDGLRERLEEYAGLGARFAKWRAVIVIEDEQELPTQECIDANAEALARYAALCQEGGIVPIVEPEVLIDGTHTIERCDEVTEETLRSTFTALYRHRVHLAGMILKPNMVISGKDASNRAGVEEVARRTVECLLRSVPGAVPGIAFLSGGQSEQEATAHLNAMNAQYKDRLPWQLAFSYARALQDRAMKTWGGDAVRVGEAQKLFFNRARLNGAARYGEYTEQMERELTAA